MECNVMECYVMLCMYVYTYIYTHMIYRFVRLYDTYPWSFYIYVHEYVHKDIRR